MEPLVFAQFKADPRVAQARQLLLEALQDYQGRLKGVRSPVADLSRPFSDKLKRLGEIRGRPLVMPYLGSGLGNGALVELGDGSVKYDLIAGIGVHFLGHSHPALMDAAFDSALSDTIMQGNLMQNEEALDVSRQLLDIANQGHAGLAHCFLTTSGAMANENALKIALQHRFPANRILAFEGGFSGRTLALSRITDRPAYRVGLPATLAVDYLPFFNPQQPNQSIADALEVLEGHLARYPDAHAAMVFELVLGEGGCYPGDRAFFSALMERLRHAGIPVIIDEIQTFGRTPAPFAFQYFGLDRFADIVTVGKMTQVCATLFRTSFNPAPGLISQTFIGATSALFAARVILDTLINGGYFGPDGKITRLHRHFLSHLKRLGESHPERLQGPFGIGAMVAFTPFDGSRKMAERLVSLLFEEGVLAFLAGHDPYRVRFLLPAAAMDTQDIDLVAAIIERALERAAAETAA